MNQPISRRQHAVAELSLVSSLAGAPAAAGFTDDKTASTLSYAMGGMALLNSIFTRAEWGAVKVLPFKTHLIVDAVSGLATVSAPWLFGFAKNTRARNAFLAVGAMALMSAALTRPEEMPKYVS